jgi:hypothetical protein
MAKDWAESKMEEPGRVVTVSLPALIRSASCCPGFGYGPCPPASAVEARVGLVSEQMVGGVVAFAREEEVARTAVTVNDID